MSQSVTDFLWPVRVYYEDTDAGGVVYHGNYLKFMERARTELLRRYGFEQDVLRDQERVLFAVRDIRITFSRPARFNDALLVVTRLARLGSASMDIEQWIVRENEPDERLCDAEVRIACIDADSWRPKLIPEQIVTEMGSAD